MNDAQRECTKDEDCSLVMTNVRCVPSCSNSYASVRAEFATDSSDRIQSIAERLCAEFEQRACPVPTINCDPALSAPKRAVCVANQCDTAFGPPP